MEITREYVQERLKQLEVQKTQEIAIVNAVSGAIEELQQWLKLLDKTEDAKPEIKVSK
jgi:hypothetical protein